MKTSKVITFGEMPNTYLVIAILVIPVMALVIPTPLLLSLSDDFIYFKLIINRVHFFSELKANFSQELGIKFNLEFFIWASSPVITIIGFLDKKPLINKPRESIEHYPLRLISWIAMLSVVILFSLNFGLPSGSFYTGEISVKSLGSIFYLTALTFIFFVFGKLLREFFVIFIAGVK